MGGKYVGITRNINKLANNMDIVISLAPKNHSLAPKNHPLAPKNHSLAPKNQSLAPKNHYSLGIGLTLYKSIGRNVRLYASVKVRDTQYCKLGGQGLKKLLCPLGA